MFQQIGRVLVSRTWNRERIWRRKPPVANAGAKPLGTTAQEKKPGWFRRGDGKGDVDKARLPEGPRNTGRRRDVLDRLTEPWMGAVRDGMREGAPEGRRSPSPTAWVEIPKVRSRGNNKV